MHARFAMKLLRQEAARHHPSLVWIASSDGSWLDVTESWAILTGRSISQSLGDGWLDSISAAARPQTLLHWRAALSAGGPLELALPLLCADGKEQLWRLKGRAVHSDTGELRGYVGCLENAAETQEELRAALQRAQAALAVHNQFLATLAHELRSPLSGIQSWAYVLERTLDGSAPPTQQRALNGIKIGVQQQVKLLDELLDAAHVMSDQFATQSTALAPAELLDEALAGLQTQFEEKRLQLSRESDAQTGMIIGERKRLLQILGNILFNAIRFSEPGGIVVAAIRQHERILRIIVTDYGHGITPSRLALLREPTPQAADSTSPQPTTWQLPAIGLRLMLTRRLVALQGGRLTLYSAGEGRGTEVVLEFPIQPTP